MSRLLALLLKHKLALVLALVLAGGAYYGYRYADGLCEAAKSRALSRLIEEQSRQQAENDEILQETITQLSRRRTVVRTIRERVLADPNPDLQRVCLGDDRLRDWNAVILSGPSRGTDAPVSGRAPPGR